MGGGEWEWRQNISRNGLGEQPVPHYVSQTSDCFWKTSSRLELQLWRNSSCCSHDAGKRLSLQSLQQRLETSGHCSIKIRRQSEQMYFLKYQTVCHLTPMNNKKLKSENCTIRQFVLNSVVIFLTELRILWSSLEWLHAFCRDTADAETLNVVTTWGVSFQTELFSLGSSVSGLSLFSFLSYSKQNIIYLLTDVDYLTNFSFLCLLQSFRSCVFFVPLFLFPLWFTTTIDCV